MFITQEGKKLLLKDLCARSPYGVKVSLQHEGEILNGTLCAVYPNEGMVIVDDLDKAIAPFDVRCGGFLIERDNVKPYLRPITRITEEELKDLGKIDERRQIFSSRHLTYHLDGEVIDYFNKKMLDWRSLVLNKLANEAPEGMYNL